MNLPQNPLLQSAMQLAREGRLAAAEAMLLNAAATSTDDPRIDLARAKVSAARQDPAAVLTHAERVLARIPDHAEASFHKAHAYYSMGRLSEAVDFIDGIDVANDPNLAHNLLGLRVKAMMRDGDPNEIRAGIDQLEAIEGRRRE